jgi:NitT/TauT family transport system substrate-binding protein
MTLIPFKIGKTTPANTFLAIWVARAAGFYQEQGLDLEIVDMIGGSETGPALSSGNVHLMHIGMSSVVRANAQGANVTTIGSLSNIVRSALFTAPGIKDANDLKGKIIGISSTGSESDLTTTLALKKLGLDCTNVTIRQVGVERLAPLLDGTVQATMLGEPHRSKAISLGLSPIMDLFADQIPWLYTGLVVDQPYLENNFDTVKQFMKATVEGNYLAISNPRQAKAVLADELGLTDATVIEVSYENFKKLTPPNANMTRKGAENILAAIEISGDIPDASTDLDDHMDSSVFDALKADGFFKDMERKYNVS